MLSQEAAREMIGLKAFLCVRALQMPPWFRKKSLRLKQMVLHIWIGQIAVKHQIHYNHKMMEIQILN